MYFREKGENELRRIKAAIETVDEKESTAVRFKAENVFGVPVTLNPEYADRRVLVVPEPLSFGGVDVLPPVRLDGLREALARFGVTVVTESLEGLGEALVDGSKGEAFSALGELRKLFREFKSNPLSAKELRGKEPADPYAREMRDRARRFKGDFYERLARFIADHPGLDYRDYWDADNRPYAKQWPEYRRAVKRAKELKGDDNDALHDAR